MAHASASVHCVPLCTHSYCMRRRVPWRIPSKGYSFELLRNSKEEYNIKRNVQECIPKYIVLRRGQTYSTYLTKGGNNLGTKGVRSGALVRGREAARGEGSIESGRGTSGTLLMSNQPTHLLQRRKKHAPKPPRVNEAEGGGGSPRGPSVLGKPPPASE